MFKKFHSYYLHIKIHQLPGFFAVAMTDYSCQDIPLCAWNFLAKTLQQHQNLKMFSFFFLSLFHKCNTEFVSCFLGFFLLAYNSMLNT